MCVHGQRAVSCESLILQFMHFYETVQLCFCHVRAVPYTMLIQPQQHFTFSGIAGWVLVELYIVVRRIVDHSNQFGLQIWNKLLLQPLFAEEVGNVETGVTMAF